jgi:hypothetical protein
MLLSSVLSSLNYPKRRLQTVNSISLENSQDMERLLSPVEVFCAKKTMQNISTPQF